MRRLRQAVPRVFLLLVLCLALTPGAARPAGEKVPDRLSFAFSGYGNPQRPFPGYVGPFQLGPVYISGSGEISGKDGRLLRGGVISHTDNLRDRRYPNHRTTWQVVGGLGVTSSGGRTTLRLQVKVVGSNYREICPVGTLGVLELVDNDAKLSNGEAADSIRTTMPSPTSRTADGRLACGTHTHGMNNADYSWTEPPRGGRGGGIWAQVTITGRSTCRLAGDWVQSTPRIGQSTWHITSTGIATESGLGNATGRASLRAGVLRIDWTIPNGWAGYYRWQLRPDCTGTGKLVYTAGPRAGEIYAGSTVKPQ